MNLLVPMRCVGMRSTTLQRRVSAKKILVYARYIRIVRRTAGAVPNAFPRWSVGTRKTSSKMLCVVLTLSVRLFNKGENHV